MQSEIRGENGMDSQHTGVDGLTSAHALPPLSECPFEAVERSAVADSEAFFRGKLGTINEPTAPFGIFVIPGRDSHFEEAHDVLDASVSRLIRAQVEHSGVSVVSFFHAAWALVVACTSGRDDVVHGAFNPAPRRRGANSEGALSLDVNPLPLRLYVAGVTALGLVRQSECELSELSLHEHASLALAQRCSGLEAGATLFTTILDYRHDMAAHEVEAHDSAKARALASREAWLNYPVAMIVDDLGGAFALSARADGRIGARRMVEYLRSAAQSLAEALLEAPQEDALRLQVMPSDEWRHVVELCNATHRDYPRHKLVHELFEEQVARAPEADAVVHGNEVLSYAELNRRADRLARELRAFGVSPDELVGICVARGTAMITAILAALKAGASYLPLDPTYPRERLEYMLRDAAPRAIVSHSSLAAAIPDSPAAVLFIDQQSERMSGAAQWSHAARPLTSDSNVYVIYTSGSTGQPKGAAMPHRAMVNLIEWHRAEFHDRERARVLQFAALSFDVAFQEIFTTLGTGGTLVLLDEWMRKDVRALTNLLISQRVERVFVPPMMLQSLAEYFKVARVAPQSLRDVIAAGEQLRVSSEIIELFEHLKHCRLHNHYGPTETHVVTALTLDGAPAEWPPLPSIGRPIANTQIYILDSRLRPAPLGAVGEIYIAGANVANGYLRRPQLTAERFVRDPFSNDSRARMYKTGDVGRWHTDGTIEYLGRNDHQVKIRGFRIELDEIEVQLARHPEVRTAAVVAREDAPGDRRVVAYVAKCAKHDPSVESLRHHLEGLLPEFMIPSAFVVLDELPLTPSGKIDRRALPVPAAHMPACRSYVPPVGEVESTLANIWQDVLGVPRVGRDDDFFELGGHSLLAMQMLARVQGMLHADLPMRSIFTLPTLRHLSCYIEEYRRARLLERLDEGGADVEELLNRVAAMSDGSAHELLNAVAAERGS